METNLVAFDCHWIIINEVRFLHVFISTLHALCWPRGLGDVDWMYYLYNMALTLMCTMKYCRSINSVARQSDLILLITEMDCVPVEVILQRARVTGWNKRGEKKWPNEIKFLSKSLIVNLIYSNLRRHIKSDSQEKSERTWEDCQGELY